MGRLECRGNYGHNRKLLHHHVQKIDKLMKEQNKAFITVGMKQHYNSLLMTLKLTENAQIHSYKTRYTECETMMTH